MFPDHAPEGHPDVVFGRVGLLLVNLGTPDGTDYWSMRRYLKEFLSDRRVIEVNPLIWKPILYGIVLTRRPFASGKAYASIWNKERNESPLRTVTRAQAEAVATGLKDTAPGVVVDWAMRYGRPSIAERLDALRSNGCDRILLFPLYPQYSASTTATVNDKTFDALKAMRWQPTLRIVPPYFDAPAYIDALAVSLERHLGSLDWEPETVIASFHGLPQEYLDKGDPYYCHCSKTARLLRERLGWPDDKLRLTFQSRFGRAEWLKPYTEQTVRELAQGGLKRLAVITPGFAADCVETLEEIAEGVRDVFLAEGGERFTTVPCLNDQDEGIAMLGTLALNELQGWI